jgi:hypothetical protein
MAALSRACPWSWEPERLARSQQVHGVVSEATMNDRVKGGPEESSCRLRSQKKCSILRRIFLPMLVSESRIPYRLRIMERSTANQLDDEQSRLEKKLPGGWILLDRFKTPEETVLRLARREQPRQAWVTANGPTFEEALEAGVQRAELYEEVDRHWKQRSGPS